MSEVMENYIHLSKYAKWNEAENRRETWEETVRRYIDYFSNATEQDLEFLYLPILNKEVMPSMRAMMTAGAALKRCNTVAYNCAGIAVDNPRVFDEHFYLLMGGSGVGFSVERQYTNKMPTVSDEMHDTDTIIVVQDSRAGWAKAFKELIALLYNGDVPKWDVSKVRPAGARLKIMGGRASGPKPLVELFKFTIKLFKNASGRKLNSEDCHRLMCKIAQTVIVGSVRRSACVSFGNLTDDRHRRLKTGEFWLSSPELFLSNNSVMYTEKPDLISFTKEMRSIYRSKAGERGIVNQEALQIKADACEREHEGSYLLNPCCEAILRDTGGLCNLSEVIIRPTDTLEDLKEKVRLATIIGTLQSTLTDFKYLRKIWKSNAEEERLLGVSFTGIMDHKVMSNVEDNYEERLLFDEESETFGKPVLQSSLKLLKQVAKEANKEWADKLGINRSKQLTLVKPSGTVSQLCSTASGIHPRFSKYYIRRVIQDIKDPLTNLMIDQGVPHTLADDKAIFEIPIMSPDSKEMSTKEQLELWLIYREHWCDGNPSQTIFYNDNSFLMLQDWIWTNWDKIGGLSFFPKDDNIYENAPYEAISHVEYEKLCNQFPTIEWNKLCEYESEDSSALEVAAACAGGICEI